MFADTRLYSFAWSLDSALYALIYVVNEHQGALRVLYHRLYIILCKFSSLSAHVAANSFAHWLIVTVWSRVSKRAWFISATRTIRLREILQMMENIRFNFSVFSKKLIEYHRLMMLYSLSQIFRSKYNLSSLNINRFVLRL